MQKGQFCIQPGLFHPTCMQNERFCIHPGELTQLGMKARSVKLPGAVDEVLEEGQAGGVAGFYEDFRVELDADVAAAPGAAGVLQTAALGTAGALRAVPLPGFDHAVGRTGDNAHAGAGVFDRLVVEGVDHDRIEAQEVVKARISINIDPVGADGAAFALPVADGGMPLAGSIGSAVHFAISTHGPAQKTSVDGTATATVTHRLAQRIPAVTFRQGPYLAGKVLKKRTSE